MELLRKYVWMILFSVSAVLNSILLIYILALHGSKDATTYLVHSRDDMIALYDKELDVYRDELKKAIDINVALMNEITKENVKIFNIYSHMHKKNMDIADIVRLAAKVTGVDELLLTALINTESSFVVGVKHDLDYVIGLGGINTRYWKFPVDTVEEQIFATALVLKKLLELSDGDYLSAVHYYKGKSPLGLRQAEHVLKVYNVYREKIEQGDK